ncbi:class I SAM-dependent methyltransferase [Oricola cellulosilytica]|nr:class I SAM-dependent methyltransferase [Oricola cellulosilytica]
MKLWIQAHHDRIQGREILHFAPEAAVTAFIAPMAGKYVTADIDGTKADISIDLEQINLPDCSYDVTICSHVLEHVDDTRAFAELHRILRPGGLLLLMTPVIWSWPETYENPGILSDTDRKLHFGQRDHVRYFGADIRERIERSGFDPTMVVAKEPDVSRLALKRGDVLFVCTENGRAAL